jgi:hypothetical protein
MPSSIASNGPSLRIVSQIRMLLEADQEGLAQSVPKLDSAFILPHLVRIDQDRRAMVVGEQK